MWEPTQLWGCLLVLAHMPGWGEGGVRVGGVRVAWGPSVAITRQILEQAKKSSAKTSLETPRSRAAKKALADLEAQSTKPTTPRSTATTPRTPRADAALTPRAAAAQRAMDDLQATRVPLPLATSPCTSVHLQQFGQFPQVATADGW